MFLNLFGLVSVALSIAAFFAAFALAKRIPRCAAVALTVGAILFAIPGATYSAYYLHLFPEWEWYFEFRSCRGTELAVVPIGAAGGALASWLGFLVRLPVFGMALLASVIPFCKPLIGPFPADHFKDVVKDGVWRQSTNSTCGAASTATLLTWFGRAVTEEQVARRAHSYNGGTEAWYLARVLREEGLNAEFEFLDPSELPKNFPVMTGVSLGGIGHFMTFLGKEGEDYVVGDPLFGREVLTAKQLHARYHFSGFHLVVSGDFES